MVGHWDGGVEYLPKPDSHVVIVSENEGRTDGVLKAERAPMPVESPAFQGATLKMYGDLPVYVHDEAAA
jgi:hypothetical protein